MPYELVADGKLVPLGDRKYLLSPQDLAGLEVLPELVRLGVASLKIEGRLKVAGIRGQHHPHLPQRPRPCGRSAPDPRAQRSPSTVRKLLRPGTRALRPPVTDRYGMEMAFSRGLYTGWFRGTNNQQLVHGRFGKKRGVFLGEVSRVGRDGLIKLQGPLKPGDGVVFDAGHPEEEEEGGRVYEVEVRSAGVRSAGRNAERGVRLKLRLASAGGTSTSGASTWGTSSGRRVTRNWTGACGRASKGRRRDSSARRRWKCRPGRQAAHPHRRATSWATWSASPPRCRWPGARSQPLTTERLREQLGRLGGTPFKLGELKNCLEGKSCCPSAN